MSVPGPALLEQVAAGLAAQAGYGGDCQLTGMSQGGNNQVYRLSVSGKDFVLKKYLASEGDKRDRLDAEWRFLALLDGAEFGDEVPRAYAVDRAAGAALYDFVDGRKLDARELSGFHVGLAAAFLRRLNDPVLRNAARQLGAASDAHFSLAGHAAALDARLEQLVEPAASSAALGGLLGEMHKSWRQVRNHLQSEAVKLGLGWDEQLSPQERILSPSDFGFHNALLTSDSRLVFIDFEYAGWDDPAKTAADFFLQPAVRVGEQYYEEFLDACLGHFAAADRPRHIRRARMLRPVFGLIWCCIVLNPFIPGWGARRTGSVDSAGLEYLQQQRLERAGDMLRNLNLSL